MQILPPPHNAPRAPVEIADHPFILEFPIKGSDFWPLTNYRRIQEHRRLTLLLNLLLTAGTSLQPPRPQHFWASIFGDDGRPETKWVQEFFFSDLGAPVVDELSRSAGQLLEQVESTDYYSRTGFHGSSLQVPADLDESICLYLQLGELNRPKLDRAAFWMDMASRQWANATSSSFASLVSAAESLTDRGTTHRAYCDQCDGDSQHEVPGATERFRAFFETFAPGVSRRRRTQMYTLRSGILHGSTLMQLDQNRRFGWDPPGEDQMDLHRELWGLMRVAVRNWLKNPPS